MLINLRNALMAGKRLPYDAEVEFLESTGTQWIDTGIIPDDTTGYLVRCSANSVGGNKTPCGQREDTGNTRWYVNFSSRLEFSWNGYRAVGTYNANTWYDIGFNWMNSRTGTKDGSTVFNISQQLTTRTRTAYAFANHGLTSAITFFDGKIASLKISQGASLVRDFIPVRKGTVGYLYDRVSGKLFGNAGTGDFVLGPDVVPVEWIRTTGSQCINTGIMATPDSVIRCTLTPVSNIANGMVFWGAGKADGSAGYGDMVELVDQYSNGGHIVFIATGRAANGLGFSYGNTLVTTANCSTGSLTVNDTTAITANRLLTGTAQYPLYIGCANIAGTRFRNANCKYHSFAIEQSGILVGSFYPVRVGTDATSWEGAMMDVLTRRIYRNAGTGAFTYGNDLKYPIPAE